MKLNKAKLLISLNPLLKKELEEFAQKNYKSMSAVIEIALIELIRKEEKKNGIY